MLCRCKHETYQVTPWNTGQVSTDDQKRSAEIHGEALKMAGDDVPGYLLERLAKGLRRERPTAHRDSRRDCWRVDGEPGRADQLDVFGDEVGPGLPVGAGSGEDGAASQRRGRDPVQVAADDAPQLRVASDDLR